VVGRSPEASRRNRVAVHCWTGATQSSSGRLLRSLEGRSGSSSGMNEVTRGDTKPLYKCWQAPSCQRLVDAIFLCRLYPRRVLTICVFEWLLPLEDSCNAVRTANFLQRLDTCQFWPDWRCDWGESKVTFRYRRLGVSPRHCTRAQVCVTWTNRGCSIDMMHMASFTVRNYRRIWQTRRSWERVLRTRSSRRGTLVCDACRSADAFRKK